jgi:hypothetical protein
MMNAIAWVRDQAAAVKSGAGIEISAGEASFARQRILALADGLEAGLDLPDAETGEVVDG